MTACGLRSEVVMLADGGEVRILDSAAQAERELAAGFRPAVVILGAAIQGAGATELARRMAGQAAPAIPVLTVSQDADRIRMTLLNDEAASSSGPERLEDLLRALEELCAEPARLAG